MDVGATKTVRVFARRRYTPSSISVRAGEAYQFSVDMSQRWRDGSIECGPDGWDRDDVEFGMKELAIRFKENNRRVPEANWFEIIGTVNQEDPYTFRVLQHIGKPWTPTVDGELYFFANDLLDQYGNNLGDIEVVIERLE